MEFIKKEPIIYVADENTLSVKVAMNAVQPENKKKSRFTPVTSRQQSDVRQNIETDTTKKVWPDKTILIVEDESSNYKYIEALLRNRAKIVWTKTGQEAISICNSSKIDLVLMDIKLPQMNGYEATRIIKNDNSEIPIIAVTAYAMTTDKQQCFDAGCDAYISKPFKMEELISLINNYIG